MPILLFFYNTFDVSTPDRHFFTALIISLLPNAPSSTAPMTSLAPIVLALPLTSLMPIGLAIYSAYGIPDADCLAFKSIRGASDAACPLFDSTRPARQRWKKTETRRLRDRK